jgi:hypothetical protein
MAVNNIHRENGLRGLRESIISSIITYANSSGIFIAPNIDNREMLGVSIDCMVADYRPQDDAWPAVKGTMFYDDYLAKRRKDEALTAYDLCRSGLNGTDFSDLDEFVEHKARVLKEQMATVVFKRCGTCNEAKPTTKFRKHGGSECIACRSKKSRKKGKSDGGDEPWSMMTK